MNTQDLIPSNDVEYLSPPEPSHPAHDLRSDLIEKVEQTRDALLAELKMFKAQIECLELEMIKRAEIVIRELNNNFNLSVEVSNFTDMVKKRLTETKNGGHNGDH